MLVLQASRLGRCFMQPLQHVEVEDVCSVAAFVQSIPWANLLSLELVGAASQLSPPALLHILTQTPWLVVCHAVLRQSIDTNREVLPDTISLYPDKAVTMGHLRELILEIIPWENKYWTFAVAFPGVTFSLSCSVLASDELRIAWERCYQRFREGLNPGLDNDGQQLHIVTGEGYDYDWDYEAYSDHDMHQYNMALSAPTEYEYEGDTIRYDMDIIQYGVERIRIYFDMAISPGHAAIRDLGPFNRETRLYRPSEQRISQILPSGR
ncbi:hypothetical protein C8R45DRAFT_922286 [Mycena sanguinolenta]|nr:hypothetical protein C8R45DRAFT_922286 [Mycena sanguinolenta]